MEEELQPEPPLPYPEIPPEQRNDLPIQGPGAAASIGGRALARIVDSLLVSIPFAFLSTRYIDVDEQAEVVHDRRPLWLFIAGLVVPVIYEIVLTWYIGQTAGKAILGIKVVRHAEGFLIGPLQSVIRYFVPWGAFLFLPLLVSSPSILQFITLIPVVIYLTAAFDAVGRGLHDKLAGTVVLRTR